LNPNLNQTEPLADFPKKLQFLFDPSQVDEKLLTTDERFQGMSVFEYQQDGMFKYTSGYFVNDYQGVNVHKQQLKEKGFEHAFVVAFVNGERINLEKAINLAKK
jgi:hypothetical protein